jgi:5,10-methylenetetrahydromethanopterin reductase
MSDSSPVTKPVLSLLLNAEYPTAQLVKLGELAEQVGYHALWYTDLRFARDCFLGLGAIAARTQRILLGPGVSDPYSRHPALTAASIATLDELTGGRAVMGLGIGGNGLRELGIERRLPVAGLREAVEVIRGLFAGDLVAMQGKVVTLASTKLDFKPVQQRIPIYVATHGAQITRLVGQIADGILIANVLVPATYETYLKHLDEGMQKAGRPAGAVDIGLRVEACLAEDDEAAFTVMLRRVTSRILSQYPHWDYLEASGVTLPEAFVDIARQPDSRKMVAAAMKLMPREVVESMVLAGDPDRVAAQLAKSIHPRVTHITLRPHAVPGQDVGDVVRMFAERVIPRAQALRVSGRAA